MKDDRLKYLLLLPAVLGLAALTLYPTLFLVKACLYRVELGGAQGGWVGLGHFQRLLTDPLFRRAAANTAVLTVSAVGLEMALGLVLALAAHHALSAGSLLRSILLIPMMLSPIVAAIAWRLLYDTSFGAVNGLLALAGVSPVPWLSDPRLALASVVVVDVWEWTPFVFLILLAGLSSLPEEPYEAAAMDGAGPWRRFWDVTWPLLRPALLVALLLRAMDCLRLFDSVYILTRGGPGNATETLSYFIYRAAFENSDLGYAAAASVLVLAATVAAAKAFVRILSPEADRVCEAPAEDAALGLAPSEAAS